MQTRRIDVPGPAEVAEKHNATPGQVSVAWLLAQGDDILRVADGSYGYFSGYANWDIAFLHKPSKVTTPCRPSSSTARLTRRKAFARPQVCMRASPLIAP